MAGSEIDKAESAAVDGVANLLQQGDPIGQRLVAGCAKCGRDQEMLREVRAPAERQGERRGRPLLRPVTGGKQLFHAAPRGPGREHEQKCLVFGHRIVSLSGTLGGEPEEGFEGTCEGTAHSAAPGLK